MIISRGAQHAFIVTYEQSNDPYGQARTTEKSRTRALVYSFGLYDHKNVEDVRFTDSTHTCLLQKGIKISDSCELSIDDKIYLVNFVNPYGRLQQLFLKQKI